MKKKNKKRKKNKSTSSQAPGRKQGGHKLRVQALVRSQQAQGSRSQGTSVQPDPGHKLPGQKYFFYASCGKIFGAGNSAQN